MCFAVAAVRPTCVNEALGTAPVIVPSQVRCPPNCDLEASEEKEGYAIFHRCAMPVFPTKAIAGVCDR